MEWVKKEESYRIPIKSWCDDMEEGALEQAADLARHPTLFHHVALMPDCHRGYGMPIGGVIASKNAVIPNAVGVDIGCGMGAVPTSIRADDVTKEMLREVVEAVKNLIPCGEGNAHRHEQTWEGMPHHIDDFQDRGWFSAHVRKLALKNLGTLGGGNHFIEIQKGDDNRVWLMLHSGSRHLGNVIAQYYNKVAVRLNEAFKAAIPNQDLAFLPDDADEGRAYIKDMQFALSYARENRKRMMDRFMEAFAMVFKNVSFEKPVNIHHNYAAMEEHFGETVWIHRKGATSAKKDEIGIIPGSMGAASYIVKGLGNADAFTSCSHGAGRKMGRMQASRSLSVEACDAAMQGIVYDRWKKVKRGKVKGMLDLGEAPLAYKDIDHVISNELDLITPLVKLLPLAVVKG